MSISNEAVEAAAKRMWLDSATGRKSSDAWEALDEGTQSYYRLGAQRILAAAAPSIQADAWDEGLEAATEAYDYTPVDNPYRNAK